MTPKYYTQRSIYVQLLPTINLECKPGGGLYNLLSTLVLTVYQLCLQIWKIAQNIHLYKKETSERKKDEWKERRRKGGMRKEEGGREEGKKEGRKREKGRRKEGWTDGHRKAT